MSGLFYTFNMFKSGMGAQQTAINVTAHNISNADTEGYSRQRATMVTTRPIGMTSLNSTAGPGMLGTGVKVDEISRARDIFLDVQLRNEFATYGKYAAREEFLSNIEVMAMEPSFKEGPGISVLMGRMWDSWQELSNNSESPNTKTGVVETTKTLTDSMNHIYNQLEGLKEHSNILIEGKVTDLNNKITQVIDLNRQIAGIMGVGQQPNDLLDTQDLLIDQIAEMVNIDVSRDALGQATIKIKNSDVVIVGKDRKTLSFDNKNVSLQWTDLKGNKTDAHLENGSIAGYMSVHSEIIKYQDQLNALAKAVAYSINTVHNDGKLPGDPSYVPILVANGVGEEGTLDNENAINAGNITVKSTLQKDSSAIKAGRTGKPGEEGDGSRALAIAQLRDVRFNIEQFQAASGKGRDNNDFIYDDVDMKIISNDKGITLDGYYRNYIIEMGSSSRQAKGMVEAQNDLIQQLDIRKESASGVNRDEETANLIQHYHSFNAAAKGIAVVDDMLDTVINKLIR